MIPNTLDWKKAFQSILSIKSEKRDIFGILTGSPAVEDCLDMNAKTLSDIKTGFYATDSDFPKICKG